MLKRKIYQSLLKWKNSANKKCLLVKGARQVGKTFIIRAFGEREYESFIEINFLLSPDLRMIFDGELSGNEIFKRISAFMADRCQYGFSMHQYGKSRFASSLQ